MMDRKMSSRLQSPCHPAARAKKDAYVEKPLAIVIALLKPRKPSRRRG